MIVFDVAGTADRAPEGAEIAQSVGEVARRADVLALSLPTVAINRAVIGEIAAGLADSGGGGKVIVSCLHHRPRGRRRQRRDPGRGRRDLSGVRRSPACRCAPKAPTCRPWSPARAPPSRRQRP